jgi:peptide/nickel transport system substrate-binding protein
LKNSIRSKGFIVMAMVMLLATAVGYGQAAPKANGKLTIALSQPPKNLDPVKYTGVYEGNIIKNICDTLVDYDKDLKKIIPALAVKWSASGDLKVYTFKLRNNVYFQKGKYQNGRKMTAEDIKYSLERSAKQSVMKRLRVLDHVEIVSPTEVKLHLSEANAAILAILTDAGNSIVPKEEVEGWGDQFGLHLVGTGPFAFQEFRKDDSVTVVRHVKYWGAKPYLAQIVFKFITDINMMANALRTREIDIATDLLGESIGAIKKDPNLVIAEKPGIRVSYISMNLMKGPTKDIRVREAIIRAINIPEMVKGLYTWNEAERAYLALPPGSWGYDKTLEKLIPQYDPAKAKKLLAEAGYPDGFDIELHVSNAPMRVKMATIVQSYLKENLKINVAVKASEWGTFSEIASKGNAGMYAMSWSWYPDPDFFLYQMFHSKQIGSLGNGQGFKNDKVDSLLTAASSSTADQAKRTQLYKQALAIITKDLARVDYANEKVIYGLNKRVKGFVLSADNTIRFVTGDRNVWVEK